MKFLLQILFVFIFCGSISAQTSTHAIPKGWRPVLTNSPDIIIGTDATVAHSGRASGFIKRSPVENHGVGAIKQAVNAAPYRGNKLQLSLYVKGEDVEFGIIWFRAEDLDTTIAHTTSQRDPIIESTDWKLFTLTLYVPETSRAIEFGLILHGQGTIWFDDVALNIVDGSFADQNLITPRTENPKFPPRTYSSNKELINGDFED